MGSVGRGIAALPLAGFSAGPDSFPTALAVADLDRDGRLDVVTANSLAGTVTVLPGEGSGSFADEVSTVVGGGPYTLAVADVNGDGKPDILTAD